MATASEVQSLNEIQYKSKIKLVFLLMLAPFLFLVAFLNFYPVGDKLKGVIKSTLNARGCNPDFDQLHFEWLLPKIVVSGLTIPANCLQRQGAPLEFAHLTINYNIINFSPFGFPFKIDTDLGGQTLTFYFVQGLNGQMVRVKDQTIDLSRMKAILGENVKISGNVTVDLTMFMNKNALSSLVLKAQSKNLQVPPQNIQGFTTPPLKLNEFYVEAVSEAPPTIHIEKLIVGDTEAPVRANFKGKIDLEQGNAAMSPIDLVGEVAFSEAFRQSPVGSILVPAAFGRFNQKDGFYQVRLGGTLGAPQPIGP